MRDSCAAVEHLHSAWVDGELRTLQRARLASHLQRCARCRAAVSELRVTQAMLRSLPVRALPADIVSPAPATTPGRDGGVRRVIARSAAGVGAAVLMLAAAAFAVGSPQPQDRQVAVPVDVYVADHLVRSVGGPVSTPALFEARP